MTSWGYAVSHGEIYRQNTLFSPLISLPLLSFRGATMKTLNLTLGIIFLTSSFSIARPLCLDSGDDTLTSGLFDDSHPALERSAYSVSMTYNQWLVFERRSDSTSMIAVKRCSENFGTWDTSVYVVSSGSLTENRRLPDVSSSRYQYNDSWAVHTLLTWQQESNGAANIFLSSQRSDTSAWGVAVPLTSDTADCTHAHVAAYNDSSFIVSWKRNNCVFCSVVTLPTSPSPLRFSAPETLAASNDDSLEYDIMLSFRNGRVVWSARDSARNRIFLTSQFAVSPSVQLSSPETLSVAGSISNPRFVGGYNYPAYILFEQAVNGRREIHLWDGYSNLVFSHDSSSDCRNACAFISVKVITFAAGTAQSADPAMFDVFAMEKYGNADSVLFIQGDFNVEYSIQTAGYNRNACLGILMYPYQNGDVTPIVWESNRSGRSHLYSRMMKLDLGGGVNTRSSEIEGFQLDQNFPNPFNPSTTIRFRIFTGSHVTLKVIDLLGRTVATLIDKRLAPGGYETTWDGRNCSSGVYFCRLQAGSSTAIRKLLLVK